MRRIAPWLTIYVLAAAVHAEPKPKPSRKPHRAILLPAHAESVPLFPDELEALRKLTEAFLPAQHFDIVPAAEVDGVRALTAAGTTIPTGPHCAEAPPFRELLAHYFPDADVAWTQAECVGKRCRLEVVVGLPPFGSGEWEEFGRWSAKVESGDRQIAAAWVAAAAHLAPPKPSKDDSEQNHPPAGSSLRGRHIQLIGWIPAGPWPAARPPEMGDFKDVSADLDACHVAAPFILMDDAVVSVTPDGKIDRCALEPLAAVYDPVAPARERCLCAALSKHQFPPVANSAVGRRIAIKIVDENGIGGGPNEVQQRVVDLDGFGALSETLAFERATGALRHCPLNTYQIALTVDATGHPAARTVTPDDPCVKKALDAFTMPCTFEAKSATLKLEVDVRPTPTIE